MPDFIKQHHNISRIALIRQSRDCYFIDKILNAQLDGAIGAIIFHNVSLDSDDPSAKFNGMVIFIFFSSRQMLKYDNNAFFLFFYIVLIGCACKNSRHSRFSYRFKFWIDTVERPRDSFQGLWQ